MAKRYSGSDYLLELYNLHMQAEIIENSSWIFWITWAVFTLFLDTIRKAGVKAPYSQVIHKESSFQKFGPPLGVMPHSCNHGFHIEPWRSDLLLSLPLCYTSSLETSLTIWWSCLIVCCCFLFAWGRLSVWHLNLPLKTPTCLLAALFVFCVWTYCLPFCSGACLIPCSFHPVLDGIPWWDLVWVGRVKALRPPHDDPGFR